MQTLDNTMRSRSALGRFLPGLLAGLWAWALVLYFWHKEGLVALPWWEPSGRAGAFRQVLASLFQPYRVWWSEIPVADIGIAVGAIAAYMILGWGILGCFRVWMPRGVRLCLSLAVGTGAAGVGAELLGLAGLLNRWAVIIMWLVMIGAVFFTREILRSRPFDRPVIDDATLERLRREQEAAAFDRRTIVAAQGSFERFFFASALAMIAGISALVFLHAVAYPETYWDSLILYMGYARKMFLMEGFPEKVVGQVGIGLGANYPHLFPLLSAQVAAVAGRWADPFAQWIPPTAGLFTTVLAYYTVLELTRERTTAIAAALVYRAVPYGIVYNQYSSDYALAIFYTAAFLYLAFAYIRSGLAGFRVLMLLMAAFSVHINYLMWALWLTAVVVMVAAHWGWPRPAPEEEDGELPPAYEDEEVPARLLRRPAHMEARPRGNLRWAFANRHVWIAVGVCLAIASPWYIRNVVVTGNPVYAFYNNIFPGKRVNPAVMDSAVVEWKLNGDGLAQVGSTLGEKLANSWLYFVTGAAHWKMAPLFVAIVLPGLLVWLVRGLRRSRERLEARILAPCLFLFGLLWFYAYCVADYYLYQIIVVLPLFPVFAAAVLDSARHTGARRLMLGACLAAGFAPGLIMAAMGFKLKKGGSLPWGETFSQVHLTALRNPFIDRNTFYRMEFSGDMDMFARLTWVPAMDAVLTHENRHLLMDERLTIVHLDDWEVQQSYGKAAAERVAILDSLHIGFYLHVPNEDRHRANSWLGMDELIGLGYFEQADAWPASSGSMREGLDYKHIPENQNVLYRRTEKERPERKPAPAPAGVTVEVKP